MRKDDFAIRILLGDFFKVVLRILIDQAWKMEQLRKIGRTQEGASVAAVKPSKK